MKEDLKKIKKQYEILEKSYVYEILKGADGRMILTPLSKRMVSMLRFVSKHAKGTSFDGYYLIQLVDGSPVKAYKRDGLLILKKPL